MIISTAASFSRRRGEPYALAEPPRPDALDLSGSDLVARLDAGEPLARAIPRACFGIGRLYAAEIAAMAGLDPEAPVDATRSLEDAWDAFWHRLRGGPLEPTLAAERLLPWPFRSVPPDGAQTFASVGALLEAAFGSGRDEAALEGERNALLDAVRRHRERAARRLQRQEGDLAEARDRGRWRHLGDLLMANLHRVPARAERVVVEDFESGSPIEVALYADRTPQENAQAYYERYKKAKRGETAIAAAIERTKEDLAFIASLEAAARTAENREDLKEIAAEARAEDPAAAARAPRTAKAKGPASRPRRYRVDGWDILVGRNPRQNETLACKTARPEDLWLHARQIPGAHVVVRRGSAGGDLPDRELLAAAVLAARYSAAAGDTRAAVDYTAARHVRKPPGTPAGFVTYSREKTVTVSPAAALEGLEAVT